MDALLLLFKVVLWSFVAIPSISVADDGGSSGDTNNLYRCGIRKRKDLHLNPYQHQLAEPGQWPWHVAIFTNDSYRCGGSLIDQQFVLTTAYCVTRRTGIRGHWRYEALEPSLVSIIMGTNYLLESQNYEQIMNVSQIIIHTEFKKNAHDIALLRLSESIRYSEYVIPICIEGIQRNHYERLIGQNGMVPGFDTAEKQLKTFLLPIVNSTECVRNDPVLFGLFISPATFCAGSTNGTANIRIGMTGCGLYIFFVDHWELRGIVSFIAVDENGSIDTTRYSLFTNVAYYYKWIKEQTGSNLKTVTSLKRISELKCQQYSKLARKHKNGDCLNARSPHTVAIVDRKLRHICSGSIISEKFVLTKIPNLIDILSFEFDWDDLWIKEPHTKITNVIYHPEYDPETLRHDVMLLELASPLIFSSHLLPICLANLATENLYDTLILNGYTNTAFFQRIDNQLISNEQCKSTAKQAHQKSTIYSENICTMNRYKKTFVSNTSIVGGPLQTVDRRRCMFRQIGVFNWMMVSQDGNDGEKSKRTIGVYSRVTAYLDWIEQIVWGNETVPEGVDFEDEVFEAPVEDYEDD